VTPLRGVTTGEVKNLLKKLNEGVEVKEVEEEVESVEERVVESLIELVFEESLAEVESVVDSLLNFANAKVTNTLN